MKMHFVPYEELQDRIVYEDDVRYWRVKCGILVRIEAPLPGGFSVSLLDMTCARCDLAALPEKAELIGWSMAWYDGRSFRQALQ